MTTYPTWPKLIFKTNNLPGSGPGIQVQARFLHQTQPIAGFYSPIFAEKVHIILARGLNNIFQDDKKLIKDLFGCTRCIPTTDGMKKPDETYFKSVDLFPNLSMIQFQKSFYFQDLIIFLDVNKIRKKFFDILI